MTDTGEYLLFITESGTTNPAHVYDVDGLALPNPMVIKSWWGRADYGCDVTHAQRITEMDHSNPCIFDPVPSRLPSKHHL